MPTNISKFSTAHSNPSQAELLLGPIGEEQTALIFQKIFRSFKENRNFIVLVPTSQVKRGVTQRFSRDSNGWFGNRVQTLHEFVYGVSNTKFGSQVRELLWWMLALKEIPDKSPLGRLKRFPNTISALSIAVRELAEGDVSPDALEKFSAHRTLLKQVSPLYRSALGSGIIPLQGAIRKAIEVLSAGRMFDDVFVTGFLYFHPTQLNLINALSQASENLTITLPYEDVRPNIYGLSEENIPLLPAHRKVLISRTRFVEDIPLGIIEGKSPVEEVSSLLCEIKRRLVDGVDTNDVAILLREPFRYKSSILRAAREFDVPISGGAERGYLSSVWFRRIKGDLPSTGSIDKYIAISEKLIDDLKGGNGALWRELKSTIEELIVHLDEARGVEIELREWELLWNAQQVEREKFQAKREGEGVNLLDIEQPHWGGYQIIAVPGLVEHWFPKPPPNPPLLNYAIREDLNGFLGKKALWLGADYRIREELLFAIAIDRAFSALILGNAAKEGGNKNLRRSHLLEELLDLHPSWTRIEPNLQESTPRRIMDAILRDGGTGLSSESVNYISNKHGRTLRDLGRRLSVEKQRIDGAVAYNGGVNDELKDIKTISITGLERYGGCPFRFFSRDILKLPEPEEREDGISALAAGSILHEILQRFYEGRIKRGERTISFENLHSALDEIDVMSRDILNEKVELSKTVHPVVWEEEGLTLRMLLREMVKREAEFFSEKRRYPLLLEYSFSIPLEIEDLGSVKLTGKIDRIDELEDQSLYLIDYKRGKYVPTVSGIGNGISLQLPLYLRAVQELFDRPLSGGAYFAISDGELKGGLPSRSVNLQKGMEDSVNWAKEYIGAIYRGSFPVKPKECRGEECAYNRMCRVSRLK
ncbi:MAG: hypothetical protein A3F16_08465 [Deltaproteobacteria bacterium RIFCSPHIGHO2_12_FULL_43_9]|nr:MAG: hypothetical protein A3F16_08465 [Deltaproteobacteria bacterium RIFCSPHIGHO2_12_FULL_43_9]